jgi:uncharacterized alpha-E superfamily protein
MLSRTADNLFWASRYVERAENTARMLDINLQMALLPHGKKTMEHTWRASLAISELQSRYDARYEQVTPRDVLTFMVTDPKNPSSIFSCLTSAREAARAVRGSLTTEVWETHNTTWLELHRMVETDMAQRDPAGFFEWVKFRSHLSRGVTRGTMLDDEALHFLGLGTHLERADNTARLLDVRFHEYEDDDEPDPEAIDSYREFYHWAAILRSVSAFEIYRKVYRDVVTPARVAELLIVRKDMPRSLASSVHAVLADLLRVSNDRSGETERLAGQLDADLRFGRIDDILAAGLHPWLTQFLRRINDLGNRVSADFLVPLSV